MNREHAPYFFVAPSSFGDSIVIDGEDAKHLAVVRRARPGDRIAVSDGCGQIAEVFLDSVDRTGVTGYVIEKRFVPRPVPTLTVIQAVAKGQKLDLIVQKLVEIGVDRICVVTSDRSIVRWEDSRRSKAAERLSAIGLEAAKQSHRAWLPQVIGPDEFERALAESSAAELSLVAQPDAELSLTSVLEQPKESVVLAVGPEGGWSDEELVSFGNAGARTFSLGGQVLRAETAPLVISALVLHRIGRLG